MDQHQGAKAMLVLEQKGDKRKIYELLEFINSTIDTKLKEMIAKTRGSNFHLLHHLALIAAPSFSLMCFLTPWHHPQHVLCCTFSLLCKHNNGGLFYFILTAFPGQHHTILERQQHKYCK
jgi:hypothetical protein